MKKYTVIDSVEALESVLDLIQIPFLLRRIKCSHVRI